MTELIVFCGFVVLIIFGFLILETVTDNNKKLCNTMAKIQEFQAILDSIAASLEIIKANKTQGLTETESQTLKANLEGLAAQANAIASPTP